MFRTPDTTQLNWSAQYRIIPSVYPPINFFEDLVEPEHMEAAWYVESLTNERLRDETGNIALVAEEDRISGPGSSVVMAAFTHIACPTRFSDASYGIYYAAKTLETAIYETVYHREKFLGYTQEAAGNVDMRVYQGQILKPLHDIRSGDYAELHLPDDYQPSQAFGKTLKEARSWGIVYQSVRHYGGECIAALRPPAISIPIQTQHLSYVWNGKKITHVKQDEILIQF